MAKRSIFRSVAVVLALGMCMTDLAVLELVWL